MYARFSKNSLLLFGHTRGLSLLVIRFPTYRVFFLIKYRETTHSV